MKQRLTVFEETPPFDCLDPPCCPIVFLTRTYHGPKIVFLPSTKWTTYNARMANGDID
jgi:hypothetical protein